MSVYFLNNPIFWGVCVRVLVNGIYKNVLEHVSSPEKCSMSTEHGNLSYKLEIDSPPQQKKWSNVHSCRIHEKFQSLPWAKQFCNLIIFADRWLC